jgi:uncharacterized protein YjbI with pentapeptide repeats
MSVSANQDRFVFRVTDTLQKQRLIGMAAYVCLVNNVCHPTVEAELSKKTHIQTFLWGKNEHEFRVAGHVNPIFRFRLHPDGSKQITYFANQPWEGDLEMSYRWAVAIAGPPPPDLAEKLATPSPTHSPSMWRKLSNIVLWPLAVRVSLEDNTWSFQWTWRRIILLVLMTSLGLVPYIGATLDSPSAAFGILIATFFLTIAIRLIKPQPPSYFFELRDMYRVIRSYIGWMDKFDESDDPSITAKVERLCRQEQSRFREASKRHVFERNVKDSYETILTCFWLWARLSNLNNEGRAAVVYQDILLNSDIHTSMRRITLHMDIAKSDCSLEGFSTPMNSPETYRGLIDRLAPSLQKTIARALGHRFAPNDKSIREIVEFEDEKRKPETKKALITQLRSKLSNKAVVELRRFGWLTDGSLEGMQLDGAHLAESNLRHAHLSGANLMRADLSNAFLTEASLMRADLSNAWLSGALLINANLSGANLEGADLSEATLNEANLSGANLKGADLYRAYFYKACLYKASLQMADLSNAFLTEANLKDADLREANLTGADLSNAFLVNTDFRRADLSEVKCNEDTVLPNGTKWTPDTDILSEETWLPILRGYCHTCQAAREIKDPKKVTLKSGASVIKGSCAQCGNPVSRLRNR